MPIWAGRQIPNLPLTIALNGTEELELVQAGTSQRATINLIRDFIVTSLSGSGTGTVTSVAASGGSTGLSFTGSPITTSGTLTLAGTLNVTNGGTGLASVAANALLLGNGTSSFTALAPGTNGQVLTAHTGGAPTWAAAATGTVTTVSVVSTNGLAGSVATATTTPAITLSTTITGILLGNGTAISAASAGVDYGFPNIPQNSQSADYTTVLADAGKHIYHPGADTTPRTWTIDSNAHVAYPLGTAITFVNDTSAGVITIAITSDTLVLAGAGTTGSRTLAANGMATAIKMTTTRWMISGTGLT